MLTTNEQNEEAKLAAFRSKISNFNNAARRGDFESVEAFLNDDTNLASTKDNGLTSLHIVASYGHGNIAKLLLTNGADLNVGDNNGDTPLHLASGSQLVAALLIASCADLNTRNRYGFTPLHWAAFYGRVEMPRLLLASGAEIDDRDNNGYTPLHAAAGGSLPFGIGDADFYDFERKVEVAKELVAHGADINAEDNEGKCPLHYAAGKGRSDLAELLLASGAMVNAADNVGKTPLHDAAFRGCADVAALLLANGANVNAKDNAGATPLHDAGQPLATLTGWLLPAAARWLQCCMSVVAANSGLHRASSE